MTDRQTLEPDMSAGCDCGHPQPADRLGHLLACAVWRWLIGSPAAEQPSTCACGHGPDRHDAESGCIECRCRQGQAATEIAAFAEIDRGYCPHCGRGDCAPTADDYEQMRQRVAAAETQLATIARIFDGLNNLLATSSRDWGATREDAWLWAVICGWDCEETTHGKTCIHGTLEEMAAAFGWSDEAVAKARRYRAAVRALPEPTP